MSVRYKCLLWHLTQEGEVAKFSGSLLLLFLCFWIDARLVFVPIFKLMKSFKFLGLIPRYHISPYLVQLWHFHSFHIRVLRSITQNGSWVAVVFVVSWNTFVIHKFLFKLCHSVFHRLWKFLLCICEFVVTKDQRLHFIWQVSWVNLLSFLIS